MEGTITVTSKVKGMGVTNRAETAVVEDVAR